MTAPRFTVQVHSDDRGWQIHTHNQPEHAAQDLVVSLRLQGLDARKVPVGGEAGE